MAGRDPRGGRRRTMSIRARLFLAARGGAPRGRTAEAGELWILDLGVGFRGYYTDNARTIAVSEPTDAQQAAWAWRRTRGRT